MKEMETHGEAGPGELVSAAGSLPLGKCLESQTHLLLATPPWNTKRKKALTIRNVSYNLKWEKEF